MRAMVDLYCASCPRPPAAVTLDIDDTVDVVHGRQQLSLFNAPCDERCFLPIHIYDTAASRPVMVLLLGPPLLAATGSHALALAEAAYRAGSLVFGGGQVVLPLLERAFVPTGWISADAFLAGCGVAQAVPGPLFTFAAFLGAAQSFWPDGALGAAVALAMIFLPGLLLIYGMLPFWDGFRRRPMAQAMLPGFRLRWRGDATLRPHPGVSCRILRRLHTISLAKPARA